MRSICALCGRRTMPFVFIGQEPIGPKCAKRAGLTKMKVIKGSRMRFAAIHRSQKPKPSDTLDLFRDFEMTEPA